ncbi:MAG TPA: hypothetical protein VK843_12960 [Planctomycetota bacterium]|nr:hypothetical protein [Planctomycetota bacterium]
MALRSSVGALVSSKMCAEYLLMIHETNQRPLFLVMFGAIFAGIFFGGAGLLILHSVLSPAAPASAVEAASVTVVTDPKLVEALDRMTRALHETKMNSPVPAGTGESTQRVVASDSGESALVELAAAVRELRGALQRGSVGASAAVPLATALRDPGNRTWLPELGPDIKDRVREYNRQHLLWTEQQVVERYGLPDSISSNGSGFETWNYQDDPGGIRSFGFQITQGRVIGVTAR